MRICIPTELDKGINSIVYGHFGSAPYFIIYDTEKDTFETIDNSDQHHTHGACHPLGALSGKNIDGVICGGMGANALKKLNEAGIRVYVAASETVEEIIKKYKRGKLEEITGENSCSSHHCC